MSTKPVVVYGASGYTGRLICEYLREFNVPFVAAGRNKDLLQEVVGKIPESRTPSTTSPRWSTPSRR